MRLFQGWVSGVAHASLGMNIGETTDMQITMHATGFDITPHTRSFVKSRLVSALGPFTDRIASVAVRLEASRSRTQPDMAACGIVVSLHPSGVVRSRAEDFRVHAAIDRAAAGIGIEVEREVLRTRRAAASPPVVGDRQHDRALELVLDEGQLSQHQREMLERPENDLRTVRVRSTGGPRALKTSVPAVRRSVPHWRFSRNAVDGPGPSVGFVEHPPIAGRRTPILSCRFVERLRAHAQTKNRCRVRRQSWLGEYLKLKSPADDGARVS